MFEKRMKKYVTLGMIGLLSAALSLPSFADDDLSDWVRRYEKNHRNERLSERQKREIKDYIRRRYNVSRDERNRWGRIYRNYENRRYSGWLDDLLNDRRLSGKERHKLERIIRDRYIHDRYLPPGIRRRIAQGKGLPPGIAKKVGSGWYDNRYNDRYDDNYGYGYGYTPTGGEVIGAIIQDLIRGGI